MGEGRRAAAAVATGRDEPERRGPRQPAHLAVSGFCPGAGENGRPSEAATAHDRPSIGGSVRAAKPTTVGLERPFTVGSGFEPRGAHHRESPYMAGDSPISR